ncbi:hypothetical protein E2C01_097256 [Portunus trituberculatus]|uniref:Uncharacterized protein n=1 Tax=Portunus trituberculatus TaxID=210409 RepID=A0A5B7K464_PORTR|nr:hypothetical protein [Portunus trituberculatus]
MTSAKSNKKQEAVFLPYSCIDVYWGHIYTVQPNPLSTDVGGRQQRGEEVEKGGEKKEGETQEENGKKRIWKGRVKWRKERVWK